MGTYCGPLIYTNNGVWHNITPMCLNGNHYIHSAYLPRSAHSMNIAVEVLRNLVETLFKHLKGIHCSFESLENSNTNGLSVQR